MTERCIYHYADDLSAPGAGQLAASRMVVEHVNISKCHRHGNPSWAKLCLTGVLALVDDAAGRLVAADGGRDGFGIGGLRHVQSSVSRQLLQEQVSALITASSQLAQLFMSSK